MYHTLALSLSVSLGVSAANFTLTPRQIQQAQLNSTTAAQVEQAVDAQRSNWVSGPVANESIYSVTAQSSHLPPGSLIAVEDNVAVENYDIPSGTSLTRFTYVSQNLNGTSIPTSAYVLWPFSVRTLANVSGVPVVAWAHGSDGWVPDDAPSHLKDLYNSYSAPFSLALQGYAVVAPDYAGLGVSKDFDGKPIVHQWLASPAGANDLAFAIEASRATYPQLSKTFVIMGHSQGGGVAWAFAQRQVRNPVSGYKGTVAISPITSIKRQLETIPVLAPEIAVALAHEMKSIFPDFEQRDFLTDLGLARSELSDELGAEDSVFFVLATNASLSQPAWQTSTFYVDAFDSITSNGGQDFAGPLLVLQGTADTAVNWQALTPVVNDTCARAPKSSLQYVQFRGLDHNPTVFGSQGVWSKWIEDRFIGIEMPTRGCSSTFIEPPPGRIFQKNSQPA